MNENIAYYLKYRPQNLDQLVGQELVKKNLLTAFSSGKLSHAYLLVGPRGTGKTSTARILAKMVNCEKQSSVVSRQSLDKTSLKADSEASLKTDNYPCNSCSMCLSITDGSNMDLIEIDAASNRGIEDIRSLREKIKLSPSHGKKKIYIIDEVHMLTTEAFNALLKTLEEPPSHALFILATTDVGKIPQTILSRVQRLDFKPASQKELLEALQKITKAEKINIDENALKLLAKKSEGSFRDGVKLLDQISSMEGKITAEILEKFLKSSNFDILLNLIEIFGKNDTRGGLILINKEVNNGVDARELILSLMDILRNLVFIKNDLGEELVKENFTEENYQNLVKISDCLGNQDLIRSLDILQKAIEKMKIASIPSMPLELAIVEICGSDIQHELPVLQISKPVELKKELIVTDAPASADIQKIKEKWTYVLETIRPYNFSLEALLRSINIAQCSESTVVMEVPYSFHQRILESPKNRELVESIISDVLGRSMKVLISLGNRPQRAEDIANIEVAADDEIIRAAAEIFNSDSIN